MLMLSKNQRRKVVNNIDTKVPGRFLTMLKVDSHLHRHPVIVEEKSFVLPHCCPTLLPPLV